MMKREKIKPDMKASKTKGGNLAKSLLKIVGIGLAAGAALVALTDKAMKKTFPEQEEIETDEKEPAKEESDSRDYFQWED